MAVRSARADMCVCVCVCVCGVFAVIGCEAFPLLPSGVTLLWSGKFWINRNASLRM